MSKRKLSPAQLKALARGRAKRKRNLANRKRKRKPMKRRRTNTGSTKDKYPNYMSFVLTQSANDTFTTRSISTPIPRTGISGGSKATIMEVTRIVFHMENMILEAAAQYVACSLSTGSVPTAISTFNEGTCIYMEDVVMMLDVAVGSGGGILSKVYDHNMCTSDGFGVLVATDAIHFSVASANTVQCNTVECRMYYRLVQVPIVEYIGIVQSQQQS